MKKIIYSMMVLMWFASCKTQQENAQAESTGKSKLQITFSDSTPDNLCLAQAESITIADFHPQYIGSFQESISLDHYSKDIGHLTNYWRKYIEPDSSKVLVYVDTTQFIYNINRSHVSSPGNIKSYPILLQNISNDTLNIGYGKFIPLIIEALDSLGKWRSIQTHYIYGCGTGLPYIYLSPGELMITSCKLFEGCYQTKMRLAYGWNGKIKSNEFTGYINYKQFVKPNRQYYY